MSGSTFGHYANEDDQPPPLCPSCGGYHFPTDHCPEDGPTHVPGEEPEDWPLPAAPEWVADPGASGYPFWVYEQMSLHPSGN